MFKKFYLSLVALLGLCGAVAVGNYNMTQGAGTAFGSIVVGGTVHYAQQLICDYVVPSQCVNVSAGGAMSTADAAVLAAINSSIPAGTNYIGNVRETDGTRNRILDPCESIAQTSTPISITTATTTRIVAPSASNKTYICAMFLTSAAADNVGIVEGTGGTCGTGTAGVIGGTTAANGPNFAANGGVLLQAGGKTAVAYTAGTNVDLCLITSAATPLAGVIKYVQAP